MKKVKSTFLKKKVNGKSQVDFFLKKKSMKKVKSTFFKKKVIEKSQVNFFQKIVNESQNVYWKNLVQ